MVAISVGDVFPELSHRERQVCAMSTQGFNTKEMAASLGVSPRTIEDHRASIYRKTGLKNLMQVVGKLYGGQSVTA